MAILSARSESGLLCRLQRHPLQPAGGHVGQGLQHCFQSLQSLLMCIDGHQQRRFQSLQQSLMHIHGHHTSKHRELSLAAQPPMPITAFHCPLDLGVSQRRTLGFICTLAGCQ